MQKERRGRYEGNGKTENSDFRRYVTTLWLHEGETDRKEPKNQKCPLIMNHDE